MDMPEKTVAGSRNSIKNRITIVALATITLLILIISLTLFLNFRTVLQDSILAQQFALVSETAEQMNGRIILAQKQLSNMGDAILKTGIGNPDKALKSACSGINSRIIFDAGISLIGTNGILMAENMSLPDAVGQDIAFRDYVKEPLRTGKPYVSAPFKLKIPPHTPTIAIVEPIKGTDGKVLALLAGYHTLGTGQFLTSLPKSRSGSSGYLYILHGRTLLMHPEKKRILEVIAEDKNIGIEKSIKGFEGSVELYNSQGKHMLTSFKKIGDTGWVLASNTPYNEVFSPLKRLAINAALISAFGIAFSLAVIWYVSRRLTRPIQQLIDHVDGVYRAGGEWKPVELRTGDEIERLATAFNAMMEEVTDANRALDQGAQVYRVVAEFTSEIAYWRNPDRSLRFISANCLELTGYMDAEFYAEPDLLDRIIHPDDRAHWEQIHERLEGRTHGEPETIRLIGKNDTLLWMNHVCHKVYDANDQVSGIRGSFSDITNAMLANQKLGEEMLYVENLINNAATPVFVINNAHQVLYWNHALEQLTGVNASNVKGTDKHWSGFYPQKHKTLADIAIEGVRDYPDKHNDSLSLQVLPNALRSEGWITLKCGRRYMFFEAAPIRNSSGEIVASIETGVDITDRILLEEKLGQLTRAVEQSPASIVIMDVSGKIEYVNTKFCKTTGYSLEESIGRDLHFIISDEYNTKHYAELFRTISSGNEWRGEFHNRRKDGSLYWEFASISPLYDKDNQINGFLAVKEDITERKAIEQELTASRKDLIAKHEQMQEIFQQVEEAKREWEQTLDHLRDFVMLTDSENRIRRSNRLLSEITGRPMDELIDSDWRELIESAGFVFRSFDGRKGELAHKRSARSYDLTVYEINEGGRIEGYVVSLNDTTELHAATKELEKAYEELKNAQMQIFQQEKMASIGQLAAGVAHEINNPMGFISSNLSTLNKYFDRVSEYLGSSDQALSGCTDTEQAKQLSETRKRLKIDHIMEDARQLIAESQDGAERVRRIVQDLKSFSRVDQAETALIDLNEALETTINIAWNEIKYLATLNREFGDIPLVKCYPQQLNQVFLNLLVNAAHAIRDKHGTITVRTWTDKTDVYVSVSDSGCGIPENIRQRIFEPFFTTKEVGKGTGLGLSISYDIIKKHNGEIRVESETGKGTTFTVRLPVDGPQAITE